MDDTLPADADGTPAAAGVELYCPSCDRSWASDSRSCPEDGTRLVRLNPDPMIGKIIDDRFRIVGMLGRGGMGTVYRAVQISIGRDVAIKLIHSRLAHGTDGAKRFLREAKLCSRLSQANTVTVLDFGQSADGTLFLVMELLVGRTLSQLLSEKGPLTTARVATIGTQLCDALQAAHDLSIIHRDLKPSNVVVLDEPPGRDYLKVLDFGLAKSLAEDSATALTQSDAIIGTPAYISPEGVMARPMDGRSDLYSLGVILYELTVGALPYVAPNSNLMLAAHVNQPPLALPEQVDGRAASIILRLLEKDPADRFQSAAELRDALSPLRSVADAPLGPPDPRAASGGSALLGTLPVSATATADLGAAPAENVEPRAARGRWLIGAVAAIAAIAAIAVGWRSGRAGERALEPVAIPAAARALEAVSALPDAAPRAVAASIDAGVAIEPPAAADRRGRSNRSTHRSGRADPDFGDPVRAPPTDNTETTKQDDRPPVRFVPPK